MSHDVHEAEEVQEAADALLINLGGIEDFAAMKLAYRKAAEQGHPIVIDPVGTAGNSYRRACLSELLEIGPPACIRGSRSEILSIASGRSCARTRRERETVRGNGGGACGKAVLSHCGHR